MYDNVTSLKIRAQQFLYELEGQLWIHLYMPDPELKEELDIEEEPSVHTPQETAKAVTYF